MRHIIREIAPENAMLETYFDDDGLTEKSGDYCNNLFIVCNDGYNRLNGFNIKEYKKIRSLAENIINGFSDVENGYILSYKEVMTDNNIPYNSRICHSLKEWAKDADENDTDDIAAFLSITTKKEWNSIGVAGYCQGDYCKIVYCTDYYTNPRPYGEIWMGCGREFEVIDIDENGNETDVCCGYIVADCEISNEDDYKRLVCDWACIPIDETTIEME